MLSTALRPIVHVTNRPSAERDARLHRRFQMAGLIRWRRLYLLGQLRRALGLKLAEPAYSAVMTNCPSSGVTVMLALPEASRATRPPGTLLTAIR